MTATIRLMPRGDNVAGNLMIRLPASEVVSTTLVVSSDTRDLPTLASVERIVDRLAGFGLVLADPGEGDRIARLVNKRFLPVPQENWEDQELSLKVVRASGEGEPEALRAVAALRVPVLNATDVVLRHGGAYGPVERRANEIRLVDELRQAVTTRKPVWVRFGGQALRFVATTVLTQLVDQLVGIPITDIIRSTLRGAGELSL
ncbi:hypothetical protein DQ384_24230 [Sphaerisporangium album]|uniref:Uncharacterized protein n=1 Tax=Sphaerisporangium album TaxID=509200 RepID=A0A367FCY5_9ACTN|nr:hypothetical protein [Sphaerisporangium album]RCG28243.1 hypothetical protein DQ384_24230 [Sphaerisporangium album]